MINSRMLGMKPGRNDPCSCGSGKKYKNCCLGKSVLQPSEPSTAEFSQLAALSKDGRYDELESRALSMVRQYPNFGYAWKLLGEALYMQGKDALQAMHKAAQLLPDDADALTNYGIILADLGKFEEAVVICRRALEIKPDYARAHNNLGNALLDLGRFEEAVACFFRALEIKPDYAKAHNNLGNALDKLGRLDDAVASYRRALALNPNYAGAHHNLSYILLMRGEYNKGWQEFEYRFNDPQSKISPPATPLQRWVGQKPSPNDRLLVFEEQGLGDRLQFSRYLTLAAEQFTEGVSMVICGPLRALFRRSFPEVEILDAMPVDQSAWQWQCPLLSLPLAFRTTMETIPKRIPYLISDFERASLWRTRITALGLPIHTRKIGIVWKPGPAMKNAAQRALTLQCIAPLLTQPDCAWFSLQKEPDPDKAPWVESGRLIDWAEEFSDFDVTAALAENLDLIISVDTSVVHLAGGLGKPTWLFNRQSSEWRWMLDREDNPWYPTMRIFTQKTAGDWDEVVKRMTAALAEIVALPG
jgi:tetratricopeptide (TPR) repeat protein